MDGVPREAHGPRNWFVATSYFNNYRSRFKLLSCFSRGQRSRTWARRASISPRVFKQIVGPRGLFAVGNLVGQPGAGVGLGSWSRFCGGRRDALHVAGDLCAVGRGDQDDAVDALAPLGEDGVRLAAFAGIAFDLKDQRRDDHGHGCRIALEDLGSSTAAALRSPPDGRSRSVPYAPAAEGEFGKPSAVEPAIRQENAVAKHADNLVEPAWPGSISCAAQLIGLR